MEALWGPTDTAFVLLGDQPHTAEHDPLGFDDLVADLASLILSSHDSTPFTIGLGSVGMGKSTLMARLYAVLGKRDDVTSLTFNAWTADDGNVLEALIKSVLGELDPNAIRRALRSGRLVGGARFVTGLIAGYFRSGNVVDSVWQQLRRSPCAPSNCVVGRAGSRGVAEALSGRAGDSAPLRVRRRPWTAARPRAPLTSSRR